MARESMRRPQAQSNRLSGRTAWKQPRVFGTRAAVRGPRRGGDPRPRPLHAALYGVPIGALGGLLGLGGAEFRLPVLKAAFGYPTHQAVVLNLAVSVLTLLGALVIRVRVAPTAPLLSLMPIVVALIAGATVGAHRGAAYASRLSVERLERLILVLLVTIGLSLGVEAFASWQSPGVPGGLPVRVPIALVLGAGIGVVSSLLGVAGGELLIPTLVFVFGADITTAGTASVLVSLPTVGVGLRRYTRAGLLGQRSDVGGLIVPMGLGSIVGAVIGGSLVPYVPARALKLILGVILIASAVRIFRHAR